MALCKIDVQSLKSYNVQKRRMSLTIEENDLYTVTTVSIIFFPENVNIY